MYTSRHVKFVETEFPYSELIHSTGPSSDSSSQFHVPLTNFDDISIPVSVPVSTVIPTSSTLHLHPDAVSITEVPSSVSTPQDLK